MEAQRWPGVVVGGILACVSWSVPPQTSCRREKMEVSRTQISQRVTPGKWLCVSFKRQPQNVHSAHLLASVTTASRDWQPPQFAAPACLREGDSLLRQHGDVLARNQDSWASSDHVLPCTPCPPAREQKEGAEGAGGAGGPSGGQHGGG